MPISAHCPHCGHPVAGPIPTAGRGVPCPHCGERFTAPVPPPVAKRPSRRWERPDWEPQEDDHVDRRRGIPDHLGIAIVVTFFLFTPVGIVAIVQAARAKRLVREGDYKQARKVSASAKWWLIASVVVGLATQVLAVILGAVMGVLSAAS